MESLKHSWNKQKDMIFGQNWLNYGDAISDSKCSFNSIIPWHFYYSDASRFSPIAVSRGQSQWETKKIKFLYGWSRQFPSFCSLSHTTSHFLQACSKMHDMNRKFDFYPSFENFVLAWFELYSWLGIRSVHGKTSCTWQNEILHNAHLQV